MALNAGTRLGRYEIRSPLGSGGMGEVYLAEDTKLDRKVALKVLPPNVASKQERMARFVREAKAAAALNHPNIAHVYEIDEVDGQHFIAMEFVDGVTLRHEIQRPGVVLTKLLRYLQQVAEGLAKAHAAGIVHRDLKPDNIMIARDGYAKILDFGLAKLVEPQGLKTNPDGALSEVATAVMQQQSIPGSVMGTVGYMSPEQAQGKINEVDHRSDIFAFGCILFEAATKRKAFEGKDALDSLHNIVHAPTPVIKDLNPLAPDELQRIVRRCLAKDPEKRYQSIKEVSIELDEIRQQLKSDSELHDSVHQTASGAALTPSGHTLTQAPASATSIPPESSSTRASSAEYVVNRIKGHKRIALLALALLATLVASVAFAVIKFAGREKPKALSGQMKIARLTTTGQASDADISPDGKYVVHVKTEAGRQSLWLRQVETTSDTQIVPPTDEAFGGITFSRDGAYIYYTRSGPNAATGVLYQVPLLGGAARKLNENVFSRVTLSPDGKRIAFRRVRSPGEALVVVANSDGTEERVLAVRKLPNFGGGPSWSPDGKSIASGVLNVDAGGGYGTLVEIDAESGAERRLTPERWSGVGAVAWLPDKSGLVFTATAEGTLGSQIWHVSYPEGVARRITNDLNNYSRVSLTADASALVTVQTEGEANIWVGPAGEAARARQITSGRANNGRAGISWTPDGGIVYAAQEGGVTQISIMEADGTGARQLTSRTRLNGQPSVTADGRYIVFRSIRTGTWTIWRMDVDGGNVKQLTEGGNDTYPHPSPDGRWVVFTSNRAGVQNIWKVSIDGGEPVRLTEKNMGNPTVSPDGKLIACHYRERPNDPSKIALIPFEGSEPVKLLDISQKFIGAPGLRWTQDGRALFYAETQGGVSNIWSLPVDGGPPKQVTEFKSDEIFWFDFSRDGKQLALSRGQITNDVVIISDFR